MVIAQAETLLVCLDFDGTLAELNPDPYVVSMHPEAERAIRRLTAIPGTEVALLTGPHLDGLNRVIPAGLDVTLVGSHGAEPGPTLNDDDLAYAKIRLDEASLAEASGCNAAARTIQAAARREAGRFTRSSVRAAAQRAGGSVSRKGAIGPGHRSRFGRGQRAGSGAPRISAQMSAQKSARHRRVLVLFFEAVKPSRLYRRCPKNSLSASFSVRLFAPPRGRGASVAAGCLCPARGRHGTPRRSLGKRPGTRWRRGTLRR